jgi:hypothetical protein
MMDACPGGSFPAAAAAVLAWAFGTLMEDAMDP